MASQTPVAHIATISHGTTPARAARYCELWALTRDAYGKARAAAALVLADYCENIGDTGMAASARGWARNPNGAYIPYTPWGLDCA